MNIREQIAALLKKEYPDAVSVDVFVSHSEISIEAKYWTDPATSMKNISGEWVKRHA